MKSEELASQRIAFEEEKLARQVKEGMAEDSEAELLRFKLKEQVSVQRDRVSYHIWSQYRVACHTIYGHITYGSYHFCRGEL